MTGETPVTGKLRTPYRAKRGRLQRNSARRTKTPRTASKTAYVRDKQAVPTTQTRRKTVFVPVWGVQTRKKMTQTPDSGTQTRRKTTQTRTEGTQTAGKMIEVGVHKT